jgi:adenosylhomocysteine nucleosidase
MDSSADIGIVCSHPKETRALASVLKKAQKERFSLFKGYTGILQGYRTVIIESGMGGDRAFVAAKQILGTFRPRIILDFGVAAGVHPDLCPGSVFFAQKVVDISGFIRYWQSIDPFLSSVSIAQTKFKMEEIEISELFLGEMGRMKGLALGTVGSADYFLADSLVRRELFRRGIDLFDYESYSVLRAASENGALCMSLRGVTDRGDESAQEDFQKNLDRTLSVSVDYLSHVLEIMSDFI